MEKLKLNGITKRLGNQIILDNITLEFVKGKAYGVIGNNGAGKTTLFRAILGLTKYLGTLSNENIKEKFNVNELLMDTGVVMPFPEVYENSSIKEIFSEHLFYMRVYQDKNIKQYLNIVDLDICENKKINELSLGMKQKLNIALALSHNPNLLLFDEPFNGLDRSGIKNLKCIIKSLKKEDKIVLISSHSLRELEEVIDEVIVLDNGKVIAKENVEQFYKKGINNLEEYFEISKGKCKNDK